MKLILLFWGMFRNYKTWAKRVEMYRQALKRFESEEVGCFCDAFDDVEPLDGSWIGKLWMLPEIYWYKPFFKGKYDIWWPENVAGIEKRKKILRKAIAEYDNTIRLENIYRNAKR